jgi:hypothetical protein
MWRKFTLFSGWMSGLKLESETQQERPSRTAFGVTPSFGPMRA